MAELQPQQHITKTITATTTTTTATTAIANTTTITANEQLNEQQPSHQHHHHIMHCNYDNKGGEFQQQQQPLINNDEQQTHAHLTGHCHYHNKQQRSATTTPTQTRRGGIINKSSQPHSHSHSHAHGHSHSNQASPFNSRHTSPHSHHSHSYHSSPHQSRTQMPQIDKQQQQQQQQPQHKILKANSSSVHNEAQEQHAHHHHHHHHRRARQRRAHSHSHAHAHAHNQAKCSRKHRSVTDISSNSLNTSCRDVMCAERELRQLFTRKKCCSSSRAELAQYFAEDLYGSSSRRPSSCCTSSDYCYQTDSTSLYGSRSSHESIKSAHVPALQKKSTKMRTSSYTAIPQRSRSQPTSQNGSLISIYADQVTRKKKVRLSPSEVTFERHTSKDALSSDLPEYACSPSPIRWSFLGELSDEQDPLTHKNGRKASIASEGREREKSKKQTSWKKSVDELPSSSLKSCSTERVRMHRRTKSTAHTDKPNSSAFACNFTETSDTVLFHQEAESFNNCCNNYIQCNTYLDQDLQITSEDIHQYLNKGQEPHSTNKYNGKNYPFQPTNALETQYKNNFADKKESCGCPISSSGKDQIVAAATTTTASSTIVSAEAHHSGYLSQTYPTYDYTNMSCNIGRANSTTSNSNSDDQHSSLLQSPEPVRVSFESFDAASERKLLSPQTPRSDSPCSSTYSVAVNPSAAGPFVHHHHQQEQQQDQYAYANVNQQQEQQQQDYQHQHHHHHHLHHYAHQHSNNGDSFKLSHAFRNVRKRARKYTDFLRKK